MGLRQTKDDGGSRWPLRVSPAGDVTGRGGSSPAVVGLAGGGGAATMRWGLREAAAALERAGGRGSAGDRVRCGGSGWIRMSERAI
jgi:hypothetical protein